MTRIAIVGCGAIGNRHAEWAAKYGVLVACCDIKKDRACALADKYCSCKAYSNMLSMLWDEETDIDLVSICVPNYLHRLLTILALQEGYHVLCEKPMALSTGDCEDMIHTAERANKRLFIVKQNRFNSPVQLVKEALEHGGLGKILSVHLNCIWSREEEYYENSDWKGTWKDGGILYTQFSHFIDLLYHLIGDIDKVQAMSKNFIHDTISFPDTFVTSFKFINGALGTAHFTINAHKKNMEGSLTIMGEKGTIKIGGKYLNKIEYQNIEGDTYYIPIDEGKCNDYGSYQGSSSKHDEVYRNVIGVLERGEEIMTTGLDGLKTVQIIQKILEACK